MMCIICRNSCSWTALSHFDNTISLFFFMHWLHYFNGGFYMQISNFCKLSFLLSKASINCFLNYVSLYNTIFLYSRCTWINCITCFFFILKLRTHLILIILVSKKLRKLWTIINEFNGHNWVRIVLNKLHRLRI